MGITLSQEKYGLKNWEHYIPQRIGAGQLPQRGQRHRL